jgi:hypothetical protein
MSLIKLFLGGNNFVFSRPERVWSVTSRLGTGKWLTLFYSVERQTGRRKERREVKRQRRKAAGRQRGKEAKRHGGREEGTQRGRDTDRKSGRPCTVYVFTFSPSESCNLFSVFKIFNYLFK